MLKINLNSKISIFTLIFIIFFPIAIINTHKLMAQSITNSTPEITQKIDFSKHFQALQVEGSIMIYDPHNERFFEYNPQRNRTAFPTASTFKILNSLIALETGVIKDELSLLTWDGINRQLPEWNRDLNLREAFKVSGVWFYQVLARRVGHEKMQQWLTKVGYGNQNIGTPEQIDQFWLNGTLKISPSGQIDFLRRLYANDLPFSDKTMNTVKDIMINEKTPDYILRGKTGWYGFGDDSKPNLGWYVGYIERGDRIYFFATNIDIRQPKDSAARIELTRRCFRDLGVF